MSEPRLISPMLDGFMMGDAISEHHGVRCCPAMMKETGSKYIVKIISVPASQVQLDALLLTGAFNTEGAALNYFKEQAQGIIEEVDILRKLSMLEGFVPYESCKIVPMENEVGYDIYLLSPYKRSLESFMRKHTMTHLAAINLGLDMCASLAVARQAGYLYIDLKPENIYISADQEYRIGDLGFLKLDSLKYASFPEKYRSAYTAPEIKDAYAEINTTADVYAAGMILYQAYNGGILPEVIPGEPLVAPAFADYEMSAIILKACDPDPSARWQDPIEMGHELVAYMQRNGANDDPIVPAAVIAPEKSDTDYEPQIAAESPTEQPETEAIAETIAAETVDQIEIEGFDQESEEETTSNEDSVEGITAEETLQEESVDEAPTDDTLPEEDTVGDVNYDELSEDVSQMLAMADDLIEHELPAPAVAPDPVEIPMPEPMVEDDAEEEATEKAAEDAENLSEKSESGDEDEDEDDEFYDEDYEESDKNTGKKILAFLLGLIILAGLAFGGYYFYNNYYLQNVSSFTLSGDGDSLRVDVDSQISDSLLTVVCTDTHGNRLEQPVIDGIAEFKNLNPNTLYDVKLEISGLRKLTGQVSDSYTTPVQTTVLNFSALTGNEEGSVILSFNIDGNDSSSWSVSYAADGEDIRTEEFTDHMVSISGLTLGKNYTFILDSSDPLYLAGETQISHLVNSPVFAQNLAITGLADNSISVNWSIPQNVVTESWIVHCYNDDGYDKTISVDQCEATFDEIDPKSAYTVEVIAKGMSAGARTYMSANAVTVSNVQAKVDGAASIAVSWNAPSVDNSWIVSFQAEGYEKVETVRSSKGKATLTPVIPGATYKISIQLEDGTTVFGGQATAQIPEAVRFNGKELGLLAKNVDMDFSMCLRPEKSNWTRKDVKKADYTTTFTVGAESAFVVYVPSKYSTAKETVGILYMIRNEAGDVIGYSSTVTTWRDMWKNRYCELDIPALPDEAGIYTMDIYFNGGSVHSQEFTMTS